MMRCLLLAMFLFLNEPIALAAGPFIWGPSNTAKNLQANAQTTGDFSSGTLSLVNGAGVLEILRAGSTPATPAVNRIRVYSDAAKQFSIMNSDGNKANFETGSITANRTYTLPPQSGRIALNLAAFTDGSIPFAASGVLTQDNANFFWDDANNRLGLGTTSPGSPLTISFNSADAGLAGVLSTNANSAGKSLFEARNDLATSMAMGVFGSTFGAGLADLSVLGSSKGLVLMTDNNTASGGPDGIRFLAGGYEASNEVMRITSAGRVGVGTTSPNQQLEITGNFRLSLTSAIYLGANLWLHNSGGADNVFLGLDTTYATITSTEATAIGSGGRASRQSVSIGTDACASMTGSGSWHTCIGKASGSNDETGGVDVTAGNDSIIIGGNAGVNTATPSNMVVVGNSAIGTGNNSATFGNYGHTDFVMGSNLFANGASVARTFRFGDAFGTDRNAGAVSIQASRSTGTGTAGTILIKGAPSASTSSSLNTVQTLATFNPGTTTVGSTITFKGQSTQTADIFIVENNAGTDLLNVQADGATVISETGGNGGNVPHARTRRSSASVASATCSVTCDGGDGGGGIVETATGGGCQNSLGLNLTNSYPSADDTWSCEYTLATGTCTAWAVCFQY